MQAVMDESFNGHLQALAEEHEAVVLECSKLQEERAFLVQQLEEFQLEEPHPGGSVQDQNRDTSSLGFLPPPSKKAGRPITFHFSNGSTTDATVGDIESDPFQSQADTHVEETGAELIDAHDLEFASEGEHSTAVVLHEPSIRMERNASVRFERGTSFERSGSVMSRSSTRGAPRTASTRSMGSMMSFRSSFGQGGSDEPIYQSSDLKLQFEMLSIWSCHSEFLNVKLAIPRTLRRCSIAERPFAQASTYSMPVANMGPDRQPLALHPDCTIRRVWALGCVLLLLYDVIVVPVDVCFELKETPFTSTCDLISMIYWTLDIPLTFLTGVVTVTHIEMRLGQIARIYAKTWLCFDILVVLPDYITLITKDFPAEHVSVLRTARWGRFMRLLRITRLAKLSKMKSFIRMLVCRYHLSRVYVEITRGLLGMMFMFVISVHILACLWHAFGNSFDDGWIRANRYESASVGKLYIVSVHWSCSRLIGNMSFDVLKTSEELLVDTFLMFVGMIAVALFIGKMTTLATVRINSKPFNLWRASVMYSQRHDLSPELDLRLQKALESTNFECIGEIVDEETTLLGAVPCGLKADLVFESRVRFLAHKQLFRDMVQINERVVRHICNTGIVANLMVITEEAFDKGDVGKLMRFIIYGSFTYERVDCVGHETCDQLMFGASLSEAALWTKWEHCGKLMATDESMLLTLDATVFCDVVMLYIGACMHAVRYAKHFVWRLNQQSPFIDDLTSFEHLDLAILNEDLFDGSLEEHFVFISHYKVEAGTEATLIFDQMKNLLKQDFTHPAHLFKKPIFIDSEDLTDLARLKTHVKKSQVLMFLLTPSLLTRPWCLVELVTAIKHNVIVILVEIQRPGCKFEYPDEKFYVDFLAGKFLDKNAETVLRAEGITLQEVASCLQRAFLKISLPFSPHKSGENREVELQAVLQRCNFEFSQNPKILSRPARVY